MRARSGVSKLFLLNFELVYMREISPVRALSALMLLAIETPNAFILCWKQPLQQRRLQHESRNAIQVAQS